MGLSPECGPNRCISDENPFTLCGQTRWAYNGVVFEVKKEISVMSFWKKLFGGTAKPVSGNAPAPPPTPGTKVRIPRPAKIYVAGKSFLPTDDQQIFAVQGFFSRHDNLEPHVPQGAAWQGVMAFGMDEAGFCNYARSIIFDSLYGQHPGAYYLDAVVLVPGGQHMMVVMIWEGDEAKTAKKRIPGGTNL
jgi:hypothetical protein